MEPDGPTRHDAEGLLALLSTHVEEAIFVVGAEGRLAFASRGCRELLDLTDSEPSLPALLRRVHAEDRDRAAGLLADAARVDDRARIRIRAAEGQWRRIELRVERTGTATVARLLEVAPRATEDDAGQPQALAQIAAHVEEALWLVDVPANRLVYVSAGFERVWGRSRRDLSRGREAFFETIHPEDRERVRKSSHDGGNQGFEEEFRILLPSGEERWVRHRSVPVRDADGRVTHTAGITRNVDAWRRTEAALRESETRFRALADASYETITELDTAGGIAWTNRGPQRPTFNRPDDDLTRPRIDLIHPEDRERTMSHFAAAFRKGDRTSTEYRAQDRDGNWRWLETSMTPFHTAAGEQHVLMTSRDVSERRELLGQLQQSEERFRFLAENAHELIAEHDERGRLLYANPRALETVGYSEEEFRGRALLSYVHRDDLEEVLHHYRHLTETGERVVFSYRAQHPDGRWHWLETSADMRPTADGGRRMVTLTRDVTDRVEALERLRESEERYRHLVEQSPQGILVHAEGRILYANDSAARIAGARHPEDLVGTGIFELVDPASLGPVAEELESYLAEGGGPKLVEFRLRRRDGEVREVLGTGSVVSYQGQPAIQGVVHDITEVKQAARERERLEAQLQEARKLESLGVLAGGIAHDFNNLLAVILGNTRFALRKVKGADSRSALEDAVDAGESAARLTRQLLAYAGRRAPEVRPVELSHHARSMANLLEAAVPKKVVLDLELASRLPPVRADLVQLEQVTMNLVLNAAESIGDETGRVRISTGTVQANREDVASWIGADGLEPGDYVYLEVSDTGRGMDAETQARIFDPFFTTKPTGHGLGLSAVLGLVRGHRGGLAMKSRPGEGTTIRVNLPRSSEIAVGVEAESRGAKELQATVLVADDEPGVQRMIRRILENAGCRVLTASDGLEAVAAFREHAAAIDLVLLDLHMPRAGGEEALRALRELQPELPVLLSSGYDEAELAQRIADDPHAGFVAKPYDDTTLIDEIANLLRTGTCADPG